MFISSPSLCIGKISFPLFFSWECPRTGYRLSTTHDAVEGLINVLLPVKGFCSCNLNYIANKYYVGKHDGDLIA